MLRNVEVLKLLLPISPWHLVNKQGYTFLDIVFDATLPVKDRIHTYCKEYVTTFLLNPSSPPEKRWTAFKAINEEIKLPRYSGAVSALNNIMVFTGLGKVKAAALQLVMSSLVDEKRPEESKIFRNSYLHFAFIGNPGIGK
jgi:hypothetical protein